MKPFGPPPPWADLRKKIEEYSYALADQIGKGFSSIVYKGIKDQTQQPVAIKVIQFRSLKDQTGRSMLQSQIQILKSLQHPNILRLHNVYSTMNNCYIVTQFCRHGDLASLIKQRRRLSQKDALNIFYQTFQGFKKMANHNVIHRDLKPANIFLSDGIAKIADFGFAKVSQGTHRQRYNVGTPLYMSPEALKRNVYSLKNDIWSMGVILFQMLFGETPWESRNQQQLIQKVTRMPVPFRGPCSQDVKDFIRACCQVDENRRITVQQMDKHPMIVRAKQYAPSSNQQFSKPQLKSSPPKKKLNQNQNKPIKHRERQRASQQQARQLRQHILKNRTNKLQQTNQQEKPQPKARVERNSFQQTKNLTQMVKKNEKKESENAKNKLYLDELTKKVNLLKTLKDKKQQLVNQLKSKGKVKIERNSLDQRKTQQQQPTRQASLGKSTLPVKQICKLVLGQVNLCRLIYKVVKCMQGQETKLLKGFLHHLIKQLKDFISGENNFLGVSNDNQFRTWNGFPRYKLAINQYWDKYSAVFIGILPFHNINSVKTSLSALISNCFSKIKELNAGRADTDVVQPQGKAQGLKYSFSLWQLISFMSRGKKAGEYDRSHQVNSLLQGQQSKIKIGQLQTISNRLNLLGL